MEIELRVILLVVGLVILAIVGSDIYNRKKRAGKRVAERIINDYHDDLINFSANTDAEAVVAYDHGMSYEITQPQLLATEESYETEQPKASSESIISISVMARNTYGFNGQELLNAIRAANLHFGAKDIFHRHENEDGSGNVLFSLVAAIEPGYFFLDTMPQEHVPGVTLFMLPEQLSNPGAAFDRMVRAAKQMAFALNAELLDQDRKPLTLETIDRYEIQAKRRCKTL